MTLPKMVFFISQLFVLFLIGSTIWVFMRSRERAQRRGFKEHERPPHMGTEASPVVPPKGGTTSFGELGTAIPSWAPGTAAHRILGIPEDAKLAVIESAYKALLKKFHPDRFASWPQEYQKRAHDFIFQLQAAKEEMTKKAKH